MQHACTRQAGAVITSGQTEEEEHLKKYLTKETIALFSRNISEDCVQEAQDKRDSGYLPARVDCQMR